jgi:hypothetical protein
MDAHLIFTSGPGMVAYACISATQDAETEGMQFEASLGKN